MCRTPGFLLAALAATAFAKTDLGGCKSFTTTTSAGDRAPFPTIVYYVPDTLEVCSLLDCGGGRAPPKSDTPGCPLYTGTEGVGVAFLATDPAATSTPEPTPTTPGEATSSPRPTGPPSDDDDDDDHGDDHGGHGGHGGHGDDDDDDDDSTTTTQSTTKTTTTESTDTDSATAAAETSASVTRLIVATDPTPDPPTQQIATTSPDASRTGAAPTLHGAPFALLAAVVAALGAF